MRTLALGIVVALLLLTAEAQKNKPRAEYMRKADQQAIVKDAPKAFVAAEKPCDNYGWAAAVEMLMKFKQMHIPQRDWVMKAYGGHKCISPLSTAAYSGLLRYITGDYAPAPERKLHVEAEFVPGAPTAPDPFILAFRSGEPLLLVWKGKPYLWYGVIYDEYIHINGNRMFELRELKLLDPLAKNDPLAKTKDPQLVSFVKGRDDANQIDGVMRITVTPR
ncbi:MAG: hypothetical protein ABIP81_02500 [Terriglobales bacterium]